jgi:hypothetical protein
MTFIKILLSTCSILGGSLSGGDVAPVINYSRLDGETKKIECQKMDNKGNEFVCLTEVPKDKSKIQKTPFGMFKLAEIDKVTMILVNESKSQIIQIKSDQVISHERILNPDSSSEKICAGRVLDKK